MAVQQQQQQQGTGLMHSLLDMLPVQQQQQQQVAGHTHMQLDMSAVHHHHQQQQQQQQQQDPVCEEQPEAHRVSAAISERQLLRRGEHILVAVSGGKVSVSRYEIVESIQLGA
eukprot:1161959-Pelagomonas_calceolata.AAC.10